MNRQQMDVALVERVCCGNAEAMDFLANHWGPYVHAIDDIIDEAPGAEFVLATFARAVVLYTHPFFLRNAATLRQLVLVITSTYADAVAWERAEEPWKREWADHHRHVGMDMVVAVAQICGGYAHGRLISQEQRAICWAEHHDREGRVV